MIANRFPRTARVRARPDFDRIFKHGRRIALPVLALHVQPGASPARMGLAVSRKVDPHAVGRNRIKRALREAFRHCRAQLADGDYVVVARPGASKLDGAQLRQMFLGLLQRAGALPLPTAAVTMSAGAASSPNLPVPASGAVPAEPVLPVKPIL